MGKKKEVTEEFNPRILLGADLLNLLAGGAPGVLGLPFGVFVNVIGDKSAGKSFLKNEMQAATHHDFAAHGKELSLFSDDCETGDTFDTTSLYGIDLHPEIRKFGSFKAKDSETVEEMDAQVGIFLKSLPENSYGIYAVDSLDGLSDASREKTEVKRENQAKQGLEIKDDGDYGTQIAKFLSQSFFKGKHQKLQAARTTVILVSQIRSNMGAGIYGPKWTVASGKALEFYSHTRIFLKTIRTIEREGLTVGAYVEAYTLKSKTPRPYRRVRYTVYFDYGIDNEGSNLDYLYDLRDEKGELDATLCKTIMWDGGQAKNLTNLTAWIESIPDLKETIREDKRKATGSSALSIQYILDWVAAHEAYSKPFIEKFGIEYTRDELLVRLNTDAQMKNELSRRVVAKWEAREAAAATQRGSKYGCQ